MAGYVIGSDKGKQIANNMKSGQTYTASDGSVWKKNSDGSVSVTTKNGGYTANALGGGSSSSGGSSGNKNNSSSSGSKNSSGGGSSSGSNVKTNTSYNGNYLTINTGTDYQAQINAAVAKGDYVSAAQYEALRNAKINYLNSIGQNTSGATTTNNYVSQYNQSNGAGGAGTNNQGGVVYANNVNSIGGLNSNWTTANINGINYNRDASGNIYNGSQLVGNGYNAATNEFTFNDRDTAKKVAYDQYISSVGLGNNNSGSQSLYNYIDSKGLVDNNYVNAVSTGTVSKYTSDVLKATEEEMKKIAAAKAAAEAESERKLELKRQRYEAELAASQDQGDYGSENNSFEAPASAPQNPGYGLENENYLQSRRGQIFRGLSNRY